MKNIVLLLGFISLPVFCQYTILNKGNIAKKASIIHTQMKHDRYLCYGLNTCAVIHELYQLFPIIMGFFHTPSYQTVTEEKSIVQALKSSLRYLVYTREGWRDILSSFSSLMGIVVISRLNEKYSHPDTLRWYVYNYAPSIQTLTIMQKELLKITVINNKEQSELSIKQLELLYEQLIDYAEGFCAYTLYKSKMLMGKEKIAAEHLYEIVLKLHTNWLQRIKDELFSSDDKYKGLSEAIVAYKEDIETQINHFAIIEGESLRQASLVKKYSKKIS